MNLKRRLTKHSVKPQQLLLPKKNGPCAWPLLYLEINGNDDDNQILCKKLTLYLLRVISKWLKDLSQLSNLTSIIQRLMKLGNMCIHIISFKMSKSMLIIIEHGLRFKITGSFYRNVFQTK